jgi:hypothetical protein
VRAIRVPLLLTTAVKINVILIFDTNPCRLDFLGMKLETAEFIIRRYFLTLEEYLHETETSLSLQFSSDILRLFAK